MILCNINRKKLLSNLHYDQWVWQPSTYVQFGKLYTLKLVFVNGNKRHEQHLVWNYLPESDPKDLASVCMRNNFFK